MVSAIKQQALKRVINFFYYTCTLQTEEVVEKVVGAMDTTHCEGCLSFRFFNGKDSWPKGIPNSVFFRVHDFLLIVENVS